MAQQWIGDDLVNLLELSVEDLLKLYPDQNEKNIIRRKQEYRKKIKEGRMDERKLTKTWSVAAYDKKDQEWKYAENHSYEYSEDGEPIWQATPAKITPSRSKPVSRDFESFFLFADVQAGYRRILDNETQEELLVPLHDENKMRTARALAKAVRPDYIINLGDTIDLAEFSKFDPDSDHFFRTLAPSLERVHNMYAEYRSDHPEAKIIEVSSNHNERFNKTVLKRIPEMYNVHRVGSDSQYPALSYAYMANLEHVGVEWIDGYPVGEYIHERLGRAALRFAHGTETSSAASTAAAKAMKNHPETVNFQGHDHKDSEAWHTLRSGEQLGSFVIGALCDSKGLVPGFRSAVTASGQPVVSRQNWTSSVMHLRLYDDGNLEVNRIMIEDDATARYEGKVYGGQ